MVKNIVFTLCVCMISLVVYAQDTPIDEILAQVEQNNKELQTLKRYVDARQTDLLSENNLPDPQFGVYYLPFGNHSTSDYTEFQLTQTIEFPTVYKMRKGLINEQVNKLEVEYKIRRQEILLEAVLYGVNLTYLNIQLKTENDRLEQARRVFDQVTELHQKGEVGILELNKAKISWLQHQSKIDALEANKISELISLEKINGGLAVNFESEEYKDLINAGSFQEIWDEVAAKDPKLALLKQEELLADKQVQLALSKKKPNLTFGYNSQGVAGERFSGLYAGLSIPLWSNRNKVEAAQKYVLFQKSMTEGQTIAFEKQLSKSWNDYQKLKGRYQTYRSTLEQLSSEELLLKAYSLGEISYMEYYLEIQFYRQALDTLLEMEHRLHIHQSEILKYQL